MGLSTESTVVKRTDEFPSRSSVSSELPVKATGDDTQFVVPLSATRPPGLPCQRPGLGRAPLPLVPSDDVIILHGFPPPPLGLRLCSLRS